MKFHYISHPRRNPGITASLRAACNRHKIDFILVNPFHFDFTDLSQLPAPGDAVYRSLTTTLGNGLSRTVERWLIHEKVATLYSSYERSLSHWPQSYVIHTKYRLPQPKTVWNIPRDRQLIDRYVDYVNGYPVIIKATGGSHGVGVMQIDSANSLYSVVDYLHGTQTPIIMREFIHTRHSARLIVLNNEVIASIEYSAPANDFRTNVGRQPIVSAKTFPEAVNHLAIQAVSTMGIEFGGVDILIDKSGRPFITEMNFPCNFARAAAATNIDIADLMVKFLIKKARAHA
jgi:RimK family alpha-L-glutamate ligase